VSERFDLLVLGSGPAGEKGAAQAAYVGKRVALVDVDPDPGGAAVRRAVIPSKTLRETAQYLTGFRRRNVYGVSLSLDADAALERLMARKAVVVDVMTDAVRRNLQRHGVEVVIGECRLLPDRTALVKTADGERRLQASRVLIATGAHPYHPPDVPFDDPDVYDSEEILSLDRIPRSIIVIGGGVVGCEYASIFTALGSDVTLVHAGARILAFADEEISQLLQKVFEGFGASVIIGTRAASIERVDGALTVHLEDGRVLGGEKVLFSLGQVGNTEGLGLGALGVEVDERGRIGVDEQYRSSVEGIYAAGDVIGPPALASVSMEQGRVAVCHAFGIPFKARVDPLAPIAVYTIPEVAMVGLTETQARDQGIDVEVGRGWFEANPRAQITGFTEGLVKLVFRRADRVLEGVHILGEIASELIHLGQAAVADEQPIDRFIDATFNVPSRSDAYKYAAYDGLQRLAPGPS
jgi:NAD(P) transhydrogenase